MADKETVRVVSTAPKQARAEVRGFELWIDKPPEKGGDDKGPMPSELFLASLGGCMALTARRVAEARKVVLEGLEIVAEADFDDRGLVTALSLDQRVRSDAPEAEVARVFDLAARACTVAKLLGDTRLTKRLTVSPLTGA